MATILCLAHYCDTHGPTPLMVTEGLPVACSRCCDDASSTPDRRGSISQSLKSLHIQTNTLDAIVSEQPGDSQTATTPSSSAIDTPPESPRMSAFQAGRGNPRRDSSFRKTYDENDKKRAIPCENCALTIPRKVKEQIPEGAPGSPIKNGQPFSSSPVLRTRTPYERVSIASDEDSPKSMSTVSDSDEAIPAEPRRRRKPLSRTVTSSTISLSSTSSSNSHNHYIDYTSTHDPLSSTSFSILRAACLRTLSCEKLPPTTPTAGPVSPTSPYYYRPSLPNSTTAGGGPLFFGDPFAGYTTAFIFRVPDPYARGRRRIYAFMCLSTARERAAMQAFSFISAAFRDIASWIQGLAEAEADKIDAGFGPSPIDSDVESSSVASTSMTSAVRRGSIAEESTTTSAQSRKSTPTSSFLAGRPVDPNGIPRKGLSTFPRSRGLAELVGRADFFIELHARFVALLAQLSALFAGNT